MPEFKHAPPKYVQMADHLRTRILGGELRPGDEVPSERQLAADWGVARPTATKALDVLRREGLLDGRQGAGTYVADPNRFHRRANERYLRSSETGHIYPPNERATIIAADQVEAPDHVARALELAEAAPVVRRRRLTLRDDQPVELSTSWYDGTLTRAAPRLLTTERILEGTVAYVESATGRRARVARDRISARLADADERELLHLDSPSAVLITRHLARDADDLPLEYAESVAPPEAWTVEHEYLIGR
jgi:DNA-binding GntR family transcriptional regulator